jgi:transposase
MEEMESSINRYLSALDTADRHEPVVAQAKAERLHDKIAILKTKLQELKEIEVQLNETPDKQTKHLALTNTPILPDLDRGAYIRC